MDLLGRTLAATAMAFVILLLASTSSEAASTSGKCEERGRTMTTDVARAAVPAQPPG